MEEPFTKGSQDSSSIHVCLSGAIPNILPFISTMIFDLTPKKMSCTGLRIATKVKFGQQPSIIFHRNPERLSVKFEPLDLAVIYLIQKIKDHPHLVDNDLL